MNNRILYTVLGGFLLVLLSIYSCRKEELSTLPQVRTLPITDVNNGAAKSGGEILSTGGKEIIFSGIAWSKTNNSPTIADDTTKSISQKNFVATLKNVDPSSTYYVRAYATTEIGVGYGEVVTITTENGAPEARSLVINGNMQVDQVLTANYTYYDFENDVEGQTTFQWYSANDANGSGETLITGATSKTFVIEAFLQNKFIRVAAIPKATSGTLSGKETKSVYAGAVGEATTVTFTYNGETVTYNILTSLVTGRKWLDRNLGAKAAPSSMSDFANYGDLFQWGRAADGHQLMKREGSNDAGTTPLNGITSTLSTTDKPSHKLFITNGSSPEDWRTPYNNNLWQGTNGTNNPCPNGWRIPKLNEWEAENLATLSIGYTNLKLTYSGFRFSNAGEIYSSDLFGCYATSTITSGTPGTSDSFWISPDFNFVLPLGRASGLACRCIKE